MASKVKVDKVDIGAILGFVACVAAALSTGETEWWWTALAVVGAGGVRRVVKSRGGSGPALLLLALVLGGCSGASPLGPVMDPAGIAAAAGVTAECVGAQEATIAPCFEVDWSGPVTYGGGVLLGCASRMWQFRCHQEAAADGTKAWKCEPLATWTRDGTP